MIHPIERVPIRLDTVQASGGRHFNRYQRATHCRLIVSAWTGVRVAIFRAIVSSGAIRMHRAVQ